VQTEATAPSATTLKKEAARASAVTCEHSAAARTLTNQAHTSLQELQAFASSADTLSLRSVTGTFYGRSGQPQWQMARPRGASRGWQDPAAQRITGAFTTAPWLSLVPETAWSTTVHDSDSESRPIAVHDSDSESPSQGHVPLFLCTPPYRG